MTKNLIRIFIHILLSLFAMNSFAINSNSYLTVADINALPSKKADFRIAYGKDPMQFGDLRLPKGSGPFPVAIIIHGGCWISAFANLHYTAALSDALRNLGIATWNIEYRAEDNDGGGYPGTYQDVANAADFLQKIHKKYSLDLNHVIVIGHSSGGNLALWLAARHKLPSSSKLYVKDPIRLTGVIMLGGVADLKGFRTQAENTCGTDVVGKLLDNSPDSIYPDVSPMRLLPLGVPQVLMYGAQDGAVAAKFSYPYVEAAKRKGDIVKLIIIDNAAHHEYGSPNSVVWPRLKAEVLSFFAN